MSKEPRSVIVKTMVVDRSPNEVYEFFINPKNWEKGAALKNIEQGNDGWWHAESPVGPARIKLKPNKDYGILDHDFRVGDSAEWIVFYRVTSNERGTTTSWIFVRPDGMPQQQFEDQLKNFDKEMEGWKKAFES